MKDNKTLTKKVSNIILDSAAQVKNGQTKTFDLTLAMEIENGEQIIGYQYLHGTNDDVGGFKITGTITKDKKGYATVDFTYQWNDIIDPNFIYDTDSKKAKFARSIPFANPTDYIIRISWSDKSNIDNKGNFTSGWFAPRPKPVPTPAPPNLHK